MEIPIINSFKIMTFKHKITLIISILFITGGLSAQQDPKAKAILDEVSKTAKAYTSITATFSMTIENPNNTKDVQEGSLILKGKKYKVILSKKVKDKVKKEEYRNDTKTTCNYSESSSEVTVDYAPDPNKANAKNGMNLADIFTIHEKGFKFSFEKESTVNGRVMQIINLYPEKADGKSYHTIKVTVDKLKKQIVSMTMLNNNGSKITYTIKTLTPNLQVNDTEFEFNVKNYPAGTTVVDLREE